MSLTTPIHSPRYQLEQAGVTLHQQAVAVVVCIHNALADVKNCLTSLTQHSTSPWQLILVDDGSQTPTRDYLNTWVQQQTTIQVQLLRNDSAKGYTLAANQGMQQAINSKNIPEAVILLNSDTIVTPWWLDRMLACANSENNIGMVGPLSNTASWQSVPEIEHNGDWATNPLPLDLTVAQMGKRLGALSIRAYPRLAFLNGFCLLIKRALIDDIGYFDEATFARGYGEENDYSIRALKAGWQLAVADDVYIYHAQSKSYSHERRKQLADAAGQALAQKHGQAIIDQGVFQCRHSRLMSNIRNRTRHLLDRWHLIAQGQYHWAGKRILFILPITDAGGGGNIVISEAQAMQRMGVDVQLLNFYGNQAAFERSYPDLPLPVNYVHTHFDIPKTCMGFDVVIATAHQSVDWLTPLAEQKNKPQLAYYIQDFEPWFFVQKPALYGKFWEYPWLRRRLAGYYFRRDPGFRHAWLSYLHLPEMTCLTKTQWNQNELYEQLKIQAHIVGPSCDIDLFQPRNEHSEQETIHICAMIRPSSLRRAPLLTMQVLGALKQCYQQAIEIYLFGVEAQDPAYLSLPHDFEYHHLGLQAPQQIAALFSKMDIFVDLSSFQAMGLTAMEAMACGLAVVLPKHGGGESFARHQQNALVIDTTQAKQCQQALEQLIENQYLRTDLGMQALLDMANYYPEKAAYKILQTLFDS
ncbi:glycosyltransferase [Candidatus Venteria ishoeyi]|uniref:N-acetylglucosaminyl-diphospho-decaprenol L-rhamnosyltransferase n=1 Tax=Candidatus Venteria ishoeyi TaxID=1899563 RepID=A0A1H6FGC8_9GAMM|nr:glycosyltransferase [Candidatus Venteria ishoeyi]SEH08471.1 N-acetylglucosaminyl-diphospho-decaprenol L-rhamnosyltransferase [Candidatus Venteria ishoeyi]